MSGESDIITVEMLGTRLQLRGGDDPDRVIEVAEYVKELVEDLAQRAPTAPSIQIALLTAINIADELYQASNQSDTAFEEVLDKANHILAKTKIV
ncbi:cell division protein ZapA [bacterium]|nr:cell division protein ZapA [bacterium]